MIHAFEGLTPNISDTAFVHPDATIIGDVTVGAKATIWPGVVLRGDMGRIVIGAESSIQDGTIGHLTQGYSELVVGERVTVGHRVILHGCIVEDECLIGMGATLLDNARIGRGSLVGAAALVTGNKVFEPASRIFGAPATRVGEVRESDRKMIEVGYKTYIDFGARMAAELNRHGQAPVRGK